jgi:hypothetical protein
MRAAAWLVGITVLIAITGIRPASGQHSSLGAAGKQARHQGTLAPDIKASALWDGRKAVEFHALDFPRMVRAADAHFLIDDEYVLGITGNGESRAYPTRFASWHHIINDKIGTPKQGAPEFVTITYCIVCNSGIRFDTPWVANKPLRFDFYGLYNGVMTMYDKATHSVWLQVSGRAVKGPLLNTTLKRGPLLDTTWGQWKKLHPDTLVMAPDPRFSDCYEPKGSVMVRGYTRFPADYFRPTLTYQDTRLPMFASVLAVTLPAVQEDAAPTADAGAAVSAHTLYRAYPVNAFKGKTGVINDVVGATPIAVFFLAGTETMTAVSRVVAGRTLTLEARRSVQGKVRFYDKETGTRWNVEGHAEAGRLAGQALPRIDSHMSQWYGWVSYFPQTSIYKRADSPQPALSRLHRKRPTEQSDQRTAAR